MNAFEGSHESHDSEVARITIGLLIGLLVMASVILSIAKLGEATISTSGQSGISALVHGSR
ncbi:hypothetical protein [Rhodanobacter koreensis]